MTARTLFENGEVVFPSPEESLRRGSGRMHQPSRLRDYSDNTSSPNLTSIFSWNSAPRQLPSWTVLGLTAVDQAAKLLMPNSSSHLKGGKGVVIKT